MRCNAHSALSLAPRYILLPSASLLTPRIPCSSLHCSHQMPVEFLPTLHNATIFLALRGSLGGLRSRLPSAFGLPPHYCGISFSLRLLLSLRPLFGNSFVADLGFGRLIVQVADLLLSLQDQVQASLWPMIVPFAGKSLMCQMQGLVRLFLC